MFLFLLDAGAAITRFFASGGPVLVLVAAVMFAMWVLLLERFWYCMGPFARDLEAAVSAWSHRRDQSTWYGESVRRKLVSQVKLKLEHNLRLIKVMIALCPLFGLLGTVTGMIDVFTVLSLTGGGDARSMAGGVSRATIPTMAGMVAALSGVFANIYLSELVKARRERIIEALPRHHETPV
ncbi:MAG: MotA/TolQ/ExbB proton channel family protein [Pseudomonadota bacterium]|jgi:biopolymer transport protein ExbB